MHKSFSHTGFIVKDLEAAVASYTEATGLNPAMRTERAGALPSALPGDPDAHIRGAFFDRGAGQRLEPVELY